jgi:predicted ArsR family transcriptional regulator
MLPADIIGRVTQFVNNFIDLLAKVAATVYFTGRNLINHFEASMNWLETLLGGTRVQLLALLRRSRRSINELAAGLGITDNAVRTHVAGMQLDGMVKLAGVERGTGGKPAQLYEITPEAEELFPKAYGLVLGELIQLLEEREGREQVVTLLRELGARLGEGHASLTHGDAARVRAAAGVLRGLGGDVEVEQTDAGWTIRGYGCPLSSVVAGHHDVCVLAESLVGQITGMPVTECCNRGERPRCTFEIARFPSTSDAPG